MWLTLFLPPPPPFSLSLSLSPPLPLLPPSQVELFGVTANETGKESSDMLEEIVELQKQICEELGFHFRCVALNIFF